jgi:hypothetical protein
MILFLFLFSLAALAAEEDYSALFDTATTDQSGDKSSKSDNDPFSMKKEFKLSLTGDHSFYFHIPVIPDHMNFSGEIKAPRFINALSAQINYRELKIKTGARIDVKLNEFGEWTDVLSITPEENYISWSPWKFKLTGGYQIYSWGVADGMNPTDRLNPRNYASGSSQDKLSVLSASASFYPVNFFSLDAVYIPFEQNDRFPMDAASEFPADLYFKYSFDNTADSLTKLMSGGKPILTNRNATTDTSYQSFNWDPQYFVVGGKTNFRFSVIDFSFSYLYDLDPFYTPVLTLEKYTVNNTPYTYPAPFNMVTVPAIDMVRISSIELVRKRIHRIGGDFKVLAGKVSLWGEFCYSLSEDYLMDSYKIRNHQLSWIAGLDFNYGPNDDFYFNFQYYGNFIPNYDTDFYKDYPDGLPETAKVSDQDYMEEFYYRAFTNRLGFYNEGLNQGVILAMKWPVLNNLLTPSIAVSYSLPLLYDMDYEKRFGALYLKPEIDIMPIDSFHILAGAELYFSWKEKDGEIVQDENAQTGAFHKDSNIYLALKYKWGYDLEK